jgi:hypothetical protein
MRKCEKCGSEGYYGDIDRWRLAGAYYAHLCVPCVNKSNEYNHPPALAIGCLRAELAAHQESGDADAAAETTKKMHTEEGLLFARSKTWVESIPSITAIDQFMMDGVLDLVAQAGLTDGGHHKQWGLDQIARKIMGDRYEEWVAAICKGDDGPDTYSWDTGVAP